MDLLQLINAATANEFTPVPASAETTNGFGRDNRPQLPPRPGGFYPGNPSHIYGLSPPEQPQHLQGYNPSVRHVGQYGHAVPSHAGPHQPLTPPLPDEEEQQLLQWHAQQSAQTPYDQRRPPIPSAPSEAYATPVAHPDYRSPFNPPQPRFDHTFGRPSDGFQPPQSFSRRPYSQSTQSNQVLPPSAHLARQWDSHAIPTLNASSPFGAPSRGHSDAPLQPQQQNGLARLPPVGIFQPPRAPSASTTPPQGPGSSYHPMESSTDRAPSLATPPPPVRQYTGPSPGHDGHTPPDKKTLQKRERFEKNAAAHKRKREAIAAAKAEQRQQRADLLAAKRKASDNAGDMMGPRPPPPARRRKQTHCFQTIPVSNDLWRSEPVQYVYPQGTPQGHERGRNVPFGTPSWYTPGKDEPDVQHYPVQAPAPTLDHDAQPQAIVSDYDQYKWSVTLYEVQSSQYDYAQSWLEDLFDQNLRPSAYSWEAHATCGFIQGGTRLSFLVLHNAADPFGDGTTTSVGVYGYYWYEHAEIYWKTFAPGIKWLLDFCEANNGIAVKCKWTADMPRASDRRFHRAYWYAANRLHLRQLLNRSEATVDQPHNVPDDKDDGFELCESDLTNEWEVGSAEAEEARRRVEEELEMNGEEGRDGYVHVVTGRFERER